MPDGHSRSIRTSCRCRSRMALRRGRSPRTSRRWRMNANRASPWPVALRSARPGTDRPTGHGKDVAAWREDRLGGRSAGGALASGCCSNHAHTSLILPKSPNRRYPRPPVPSSFAAQSGALQGPEIPTPMSWLVERVVLASARREVAEMRRILVVLVLALVLATYVWPSGQRSTGERPDHDRRAAPDPGGRGHQAQRRLRRRPGRRRPVAAWSYDWIFRRQVAC